MITVGMWAFDLLGAVAAFGCFCLLVWAVFDRQEPAPQRDLGRVQVDTPVATEDEERFDEAA